MDCQQAQNDLLSAESLSLLGPEMSAHIAECPQCQALLVKLRKLETETNALPVPAGHEQPSPEFLRTIAALAARSGPPVRHFLRRAIAAAVVLAFGLAAISLIFFNGSTVQADVLIGQLVDWNLSIAHTHDSAGRTRIYQQQLQQLQKQVDQSHLAAADHDLAVALLNNAQWLTTEENTTEESQHFQAIADQLHARQQAASDGAAAHLQQIYQELINEGVSNAGGTSDSPSTTEQHNGAAQTAPSSALPQNQNLAPRQLKTVPGAVASEQTNSMASTITARDFSGSLGNGGSGSILSPTHLSSGSDAGAIHAIGEHSHHVESHPADVQTVNPSGQMSHAPSTPVTLAVTVQPAHITAIPTSLMHLPSSTSLPMPSHPCTGGESPPTSSTTSSAQRAGSTPRLSSLGSATANQPPASWQTAGMDTDDLIPPAGFGNDALLPPMAGMTAAMPPLLTPLLTPLSQNQINTLLANHINSVWTGPSDLVVPYPAPMGAESRAFFGLDNDADDRPVPFPEPVMGFALPLMGLGLRRGRRVVK